MRSGYHLTLLAESEYYPIYSDSILHLYFVPHPQIPPSKIPSSDSAPYKHGSLIKLAGYRGAS